MPSPDLEAQANVSEEQKVEDLILYLRSLGVEKLAKDISEEQFLRRLLEVRVSYDYHTLQAEIWKDRQEKALEFAISAQAALYDKSANYNNVVTTLGYAGFFSVWNLVSSELTRMENAFVGLTLGISLFLFVTWTLYTSFILTMNVRRYAVIAGTTFETFEEEFNAHKVAEERAKRAVLAAQRFWPFVFCASTLTALLAGITVIVELFFKIIGADFNIVDKAIGLLR